MHSSTLRLRIRDTAVCAGHSVEELRLLDSAIHSWIAKLDPSGEARPSSVRHRTRRISVGIRTVARSTIDADDGLRDELAAGARDFYALMVRTLLDGSEEWGGMRRCSVSEG